MPGFAQHLYKSESKCGDLCPRIILEYTLKPLLFYSFLQCFHTFCILGLLCAKADVDVFSVTDFAV